MHGNPEAQGKQTQSHPGIGGNALSGGVFKFSASFLSVFHKQGGLFEESMMQFDIASTIAHIFALQQPQVWIGRPMKQVFSDIK